jgi:UDP-2-acetamido-2-deoxy-ribo-hexuluronate aminotransferase
MQFIDLKTQYKRIETRVEEGLKTVLQHGQYVMGPEVRELEKALAELTNVKQAVAVASGTDALLLALLALDIKAGDEVITSPFSMFATAETIVLAGGKPVFVDIDSRTYNLEPALLEQAITPNTKAIMPVSLYGQCAELDSINAIAKKYNIPVIEDAAQSFGATHKNRPSCGLTTIACTSFYPAKPLGGYGDSGACFTNDEKLADKIRSLHNHGQTERYYHPWIGINGRMDSFQAVVLLAKLTLFKEELELRQKVAKRYDEALSSHFTTPYIESYNTSNYAQYTLSVSNREGIQKAMQAKNIPTMIHYPIPMHLQPAMAYLNLPKGSFPKAEAAADHVLSLPMHPYLTEEDQDKIIQGLLTSV